MQRPGRVKEAEIEAEGPAIKEKALDIQCGLRHRVAYGDECCS
jgi:hypothetical protein